MKYIFLLLISFISAEALAQKTLDALLKQYNDNSVPYISVKELAMPKTKAILFDAREPEEYAVSHLKEAVLVGYNTFNVDSIQEKYPDKNAKIVVYCSLGVRSEIIGAKLKKAGYTNVYNLYGGIFEWKNKNFSIIDSENKETEKVHTFNKTWSKWLLKGEPVYENKE